MTRTDSRLNRMVARLAGMSEADRAYVLDRLGADARGRLAPLLADPGRGSDSLSPGLHALVQSVLRGQRPASITPKGIAAVKSFYQGER